MESTARRFSGECCETCLYEPVLPDYSPCSFCNGLNMWRPKPRPMGKDSPLSPSHYSRFPIQPLDFIEKNGLSFLEGNVIKYVLRAPYKGSRTEDLKKARVYLDRLIAQAEAGQEKQCRID